MPNKILILGGYGVFGGRLCELLAPEKNLSFYVAGRSLAKADAFCALLPPGAHRQALEFDRDADTVAQLLKIRVDLVIDATGPFQSYGVDPYKVVKACLTCGVNYMDFADGAEFVKGIHAFDAEAKSKNVFVLSGVSSFPVLTAAVVRFLARGLSQVTSIRGGIAPSPFAGVGQNVIRAIAAYAGQKIRLTRSGVQAYGYALTETCRYTIAPPGHLPLANIRFSLVDVPDLQVLPELWPGLQHIWMGAGPVPEVLHRLLNLMAWLVRLRLVSSLTPFAPLFFQVINRLRWGEHRGGMFVEVAGELLNGRQTVRSWHLLAEGSDGPYIPCMALQALVLQITRGQTPPHGARPASGGLELDDYEALFAKRTIYTGQRQTIEGDAPDSVFKTLLGTAWHDLPPPLQRLHDGRDIQRWSGSANVERGTHWLAHAIANVFGFPASTDAQLTVPIQVDITPDTSNEIWTRTFGKRSFHSTLCAGKGHYERLLTERFGPLTFALALVWTDGKLHYKVRNWQLLGVPMPNWLAPSGNTYESAGGERFCFHIEIRLPLVGLIVKYVGWLEPVKA